MGESRKESNKRIRQEALREWLSKKCTAQHLVENIQKIEKLDANSECFRNDLDKLKVANDQRLKILNKYLPDLKQSEIIGDPKNPLATDGKITIQFVDVPDDPAST